MNQKQKKIVLALCGIAVLSLIAAGLYLACGRKSLQKNNPQTDKQVQTKQQENEPQAGLDPSGRDEILDLVAKLHKERKLTVILVSHSMEDVARYVERLIVMNHGTVAFDATPGEVFSHYKELEKIGLMAPQVTYVMEGLARRGVTLPHNAITVQEAVDSILQAR